MKSRFYFARVAIGLLLLSGLGCGRQPSGTDTMGSEKVGDMLARVNQVRAQGTQCGNDFLPPAAKLEWENRLTEAAKAHGDEMAQQRYFDHTGLDGSSVGDRVREQGYSWATVGENIAQGQTSVASVVADWVKSEGHCRNLMNPKFRQLGAYRSGNVWVQVFATPAR